MLKYKKSRQKAEKYDKMRQITDLNSLNFNTKDEELIEQAINIVARFN